MTFSDNKQETGKEDKKRKTIIQMYLTARQFKNAVLIEEMIIIPAQKNNLPEGAVLSFGDTIKISARGNKTITKMFPFVVNKAFACEVYLKLILIENGIKLEEFNRRELHNLSKLYKKTDESFKEIFIKIFLKQYGTKADKTFLEKEIENIAIVFAKWRYIYEELEKENIVNYGFLNSFCDYLDVYTRSLILEKYNYDVNLDMR